MTSDIYRVAFETAYVARARTLGVELDTNPEYMRGLRVGETYGDRPYLNGMYDGWTLRGDTAEKQRDAANAALEVTGENMRLAEKQRDTARDALKLTVQVALDWEGKANAATVSRDAAYAALDAVIEYAHTGRTLDANELLSVLMKHGVHERRLMPAPKPTAAEGVREFIYRGVCMTCKEKIRDDSGIGYICGCTRV
jgi:hypothetical protein